MNNSNEKRNRGGSGGSGAHPPASSPEEPPGRFGGLNALGSRWWRSGSGFPNRPRSAGSQMEVNRMTSNRGPRRRRRRPGSGPGDCPGRPGRAIHAGCGGRFRPDGAGRSPDRSPGVTRTKQIVAIFRMPEPRSGEHLRTERSEPLRPEQTNNPNEKRNRGGSGGSGAHPPASSPEEPPGRFGGLNALGSRW